MHISQLIFRAAQQRGQEAALEYQGVVRNWSETAHRVTCIAGALAGLNLGRNDRVAILGLNSGLYFESLFAIPQLGARMVPLNIRWAVPEFSYSLQDSGSKALLFDAMFAPAVEALRAEDTPVEHYLFMGDEADCPEWALSIEALLSVAEPVLESVISDDDLAGIFYTGGTTGFPKGVMLSHNALFTSALSIAACSDADENSAVLHAAPMFHLADLATVFMFTVLGAKHVIIPAFDPLAVINAIEQSCATDALLVPAMVQLVFDHPEFDAEKIRPLKRMLYGASPMPEGLLRRVMAALPELDMMQAYGQTEMAPVVTVLLPDDHRAALAGEGNSANLLRAAGRASYSVQIKVVDDEGNTLPTGQVGELCASGPNAMLGYWNKPEQTAAAMKGHWVHSGDAGYIDENGYLFIVDRVKDMVVTGGENVFSAEVESALSTHASIAQVAVIGVPHDEWGEAVHAIVVPQAGAERDEAAIIAHAKTKIAAYKCPKSVSFRDEPLPLSGAGKVLKRELRAPYWEGRDRQVN